MKNYDGPLLLIHEFFSNKNPKNFVAFAILKRTKGRDLFPSLPFALFTFFSFLVRFVLLVLLLKALRQINRSVKLLSSVF